MIFNSAEPYSLIVYHCLVNGPQVNALASMGLRAESKGYYNEQKVNGIGTVGIEYKYVQGMTQ